MQISVVILITTVLLYPIIISLNRNRLKLSMDLSSANIGMLDALGAMAPSVYREIGTADDSVLENMLDKLIRKYFPEG